MRHESAEKGKMKTIRMHIFSGYLALTGIMAFLVIGSIILFQMSENGYSKQAASLSRQNQAQAVIAAHYKWLEQLSDAITSGQEFKGSLDPETCALGQWLKSSETELMSDTKMSKEYNTIIQPHKDIHLTAEKLIEMSRTDKDAAYQLYSSEYKPKVEQIGEGLTAISDRYKEIEEKAASYTKQIAVVSKILLVLTGFVAAGFCIQIGRKVAKRISEPVIAVERWSQKLAAGADVLDLDAQNLDGGKSGILELTGMITAFRQMADSIHNNVKVIQKVAAGDLTAYVDIKSSEDSLGQNLYHLVQNNDFMFSKLLNVADSVAGHANHIANTSQALAQSSSEQAAAVEVLSSTVEQANLLASKNAEESNMAAKNIFDMEQEVGSGQEKMEQLFHAVEEIREASVKISVVMKSINDIAFQTNILALNAAVEAARAGTAGKGFAVVADEVRELSLKSAEAAEQSRILIENTLEKTQEGTSISEETSVTFQEIVKSVSQISGIMKHINEASTDQQTYIAGIHNEISKISSSVAQNAAYSEETAAATQKMNVNAELIRKEMKRFNLRKREEGRPYIPSEKLDDEEFIQVATENYYKSQKQQGNN